MRPTVVCSSDGAAPPLRYLYSFRRSLHMTTSAIFTHRIPDADKSPQPSEHLVPQRKATFRWPPDCRWQRGFLLTVNGSHFVSSSVVVVNVTTLSNSSHKQSAVEGRDHDRLDLCSGNSKRDSQYSEWELRHSWLHEWWNQPRPRLDYHLE